MQSYYTKEEFKQAREEVNYDFFTEVVKKIIKMTASDPWWTLSKSGEWSEGEMYLIENDAEDLGLILVFEDREWDK